MKIRTRLRFNSGISLSVILLTILFLGWSLREASKAEKNENLVVELRKTALERTVLMDEYLLNYEERARIQWDSKSETFRGLLGLARQRFTKTPDRELCEEIRKDFERTISMFFKIVENRAREKNAGKGSLFSPEGEKRLLGQIILNAYTLNDSIGRLHESADRTSTTAHKRIVLFLIIFIALVVVATVGNSAIVNRILTKRIAKLHQGTEIIGAGNLDYRIDIKGADELSDLARASNEMAAHLKESYTSVENLQKEIAERKLAEETVRKSEERYRSLFVNMLEGFAYCKMLFVDNRPQDFVYIEVNSAFEVLTGLKNVAGRRVSDVIPGIRKSDPELFEIYGRVALTGKPERFEIYVEALTTWFNISVYSPKKEYFVAVFDVITKRKQAEEALLESSEFSRQIIESAQEGLIVYGLDLKYQVWNPFMEQLTGRPAGEVLGRHPLEIFPFLRATGVIAAINMALVGEITEAERFQFHIPGTGRSGWTSDISAPLRNAKGEIIGVIGTVRDITGHVLAEQALVDSEKKYRSLVDNALVGVYRSTLEGKFVYVNEAMARIFECESAEEMLSEDVLLRYKDQRDREVFVETLKKKGAVNEFEIEVLTRKGKIIDILISATLEGDIISGMIIDISERKRAEGELVRLYQQLKEEAEVSGSLLQMVEALNKNLDERELIKTVVQLAPRYLRFDRIGIFLYDESVRGFTFSGGYGFSLVEEGILLSRNFRPGDFPAMDKAVRGETVIIEDATKIDLISKELVDAFGVKSAVIVPVSAREKVIGGIYGDYRTLRPIEKREVSFLKGLADGIAIALQNSRLYRESVERLMELSGKIETIKAMAQLDRDILSNIDRSTILRTATALINRIIPCDRAAVALKEGATFTIVSEWGIGEFHDKTYPIEGSHFESVEKSSTSLFLADLSEDKCPYHKEQSSLGIKAGLLVPLVTKDGVIGFLDIGSVHPGRLTPADLSTAENIASQIAVALENARLYEELRQLLINTITSLASAIDAKSPWTKGHSERVTQYALQIGKEMGLKDEELERLKLSGLLHDVGKIGTYDVLLDKLGELTDEEFELVKKHPVKGAEILAPISQLADIMPGVLHHHERYDGKGYPDGLAGDAIPFQARILCVADSFDSMTADRPYRPSPGKEYAISEFRRCSSTQFDPQVVDAFLKVLGS